MRKFSVISCDCEHGENRESIEWFIEDQAISPSLDLALPPPPSVISTGDTQDDWETETTCRREIGGGGGGGAKSYDVEKAWSSINHSLLSGTTSFPEKRARAQSSIPSIIDHTENLTGFLHIPKIQKCFPISYGSFLLRRKRMDLIKQLRNM